MSVPDSDPLTGLPTRSALHSMIAAALDRPGENVGVALIDIDGFAGFNAALGQDSGDAALVEIGKRLVLEVGGQGTVARLPGDEFAVLLPACTPDALRDLAQRCLRVVRQPLPGVSLLLTASIGTAIGPGDAAQDWELINVAAIAQFVAKSAGRDRVAAARPLMRSQVEKSVRDGIASGQFGLNYQPVVTLGDPPVLAGVEAFLRWHHPARGLIFPSHFLPLLEDSRLARLLGGKVLDEAAMQARKWTDTRFAFGRIGVNVSMHHLREGDIAADIAAVFGARRVPTNVLALDLPCDVYEPRELQAMRARLLSLREIGVTLAIDSGPSETFDLAALQRLPVGVIKLDRSFEASLSPPALAGIISDIRAAGLSVIAEGVETPERQQLLATAGCDRAQGWGIARPMPPAKLPAFAAKLGQGTARKAA